MTDAAGTLTGALHKLFEKGVRYSTVMDIGCADGHFFLDYLCDGTFAGAAGVFVDPSPAYEASLRAIIEAIGGHYLIAAVSDKNGEMEMTTAVHPYWNSLRPAGDSYWEHLNRLTESTMRVPAYTIDTITKRLGLAAPFLIKLDIQGAEAAALRGARDTLRDTSVVLCEADLGDFPEINRILEEAGFGLFDLTEMRRIADQSLGWFYPVYLNRKLDSIRRRSYWDAQFNDMIVQRQRERQEWIRTHNADLLRKIKAARNAR